MEQTEVQELDTFEDGSYTEGPMEEDGNSQEESQGQSTEETPVQTEKKEEVDSDSQVSLLDEKEDTGTKEGEEKKEENTDKSEEGDKKEDEDSKSEESSSKSDDGKDDGSTEEEVRTIKAFSNGKQYEIPENLEIKTKVDGKWEKPTLQELKDNYSGKVAYDKKFSELGEESKAFKQEAQKHYQEIEALTGHLRTIRELTDKGLAGEEDVLSGMNYLLDLMGINTVQYNKAVFNRMASELDVYSEMTEAEREAHWVKKENEYLVKQQESLRSRSKEEQTQAEFQNRVKSLREAHGISEEDYVSAQEDLIAEGVENITPEMVAKAASLKPLLIQADDLIDPYLDQLSDKEADDLSVEIATTMFNSPEITVDQIKQLLAEEYKVDAIVDDIIKKTGKPEEVVPKTVPPKQGYESFEDWD